MEFHHGQLPRLCANLDGMIARVLINQRGVSEGTTFWLLRVWHTLYQGTTHASPHAHMPVSAFPLFFFFFSSSLSAPSSVLLMIPSLPICSSGFNGGPRFGGELWGLA
ncbi:unnamed protein product [Periconia digitata]|uniref:Uncharacterized protein n=1 Tax=Periconia digitata TaxID=1303443 RepID=A0A9W4XQL8_9PLEO|nr:unnamed protein product [Periconia digitata]